MTKVETTRSRPRPDLLWALDLSNEMAEEVTLKELWQFGVEFLLWPADIPDGTAKAEVYRRLLKAKYKFVGDFDLDPLQYVGEDD